MPCLNTKKEWLEYARINGDLLTQFIKDWHPASKTKVNKTNMRITAAGAEAACETIRESIAAKEAGNIAPEERFALALVSGDTSKITSLLNSAWFGVPESTACWQIAGFKEAVELIEQVPEED